MLTVRSARAGGIFVFAGALMACGNNYVGDGIADAGARVPPGDAATNYGSTASDTPPPPLSGGTLAIDPATGTAVASDPDRDQIYLADLRANDLAAEHPRFVQLNPGDEPGRIALDHAGHAYVVLRRGGAVVTVDLASATVTERRVVCPVARGVAVETDRVYVACASGELVALPASGATPVWSTTIEPDLRDIVIDGSQLLVSTFRAAHVLRVDKASGQRVDNGTPIALPQMQFNRGFGSVTPYDAEVAWRMIPRPGGHGALMVHQRAQASPLAPMGSSGSSWSGAANEYYGNGPCESGVVHGSVTVVGDGTAIATPIIASALLPVDMAVAPDGQQIVVVAAGNVDGTEPKVLQTSLTTVSTPMMANDPSVGLGCSGAPYAVAVSGSESIPSISPDGRVVAVAFDGNRVVVQTREPAALQYLDDGTFVTLSHRPDGALESHLDTGYEVFHSNSGSTIHMACASCHPEGGDDGHVWQFLEGPRRTQNFRGGFLATAPFHWDGSFGDLSHLMAAVFVTRMGGTPLTPEQTGYLERWLNAVPALPPVTVHDAAAVERGRVLFNDPTRACATCHSGERLTNNTTVDVGVHDTTGSEMAHAFQVPGLHGLAYRAPYMHTGCAATLRDRFDPACGGANHGNIDNLSETDKDDLVAYLTSL